MSDVKAFMLGPKGENAQLFRQLIGEALDDHIYWRRNFHPEDEPAISSRDQHTEPFKDFEDRLRDLMFRFLSDAKKGIPFFSPRYIGHMNTDLLMPALVGYFAAMLYNQNNVAGESSPRTAELEQEVVAMLARMVGYPVEIQNEPGRGWVEVAGGYLTSGGTTANIYGLWVARNLRGWPLALRLALESKHVQGKCDRVTHDEFVHAFDKFDVRTGEKTRKRLRDLSGWELLNIPIDSVYGIRSSAFAWAAREMPHRFATGAGEPARKPVEDWVEPYSLQATGDSGFTAALTELFPGETDLWKAGWRVLVAQNKHYSWVKATDLLGLGKKSLVEVRTERDFTMSIDALRVELDQALTDHLPILAVASVFGSTEEGSLDDLTGIRDLLADFSTRGLATWLHVDACYGGYLGSLVRANAGGNAEPGHQVRAFVKGVAREFQVAEDESEACVSRNGEGWLEWDVLANRIAAMASADSMSIDPHKLGYIPYPAGAALLRDPSAREIVSHDAPYLWVGSMRPSASFVGRYTLEGSRAGAVAAACWLAHKAVPLSQEGHGKLLAASILACRQLYAALERGQSDRVGIAFVNRPHLNMICYIPYRRDSVSLDEIATVTGRLAEELEPTRHGDFMVVKTEVPVRITSADLQSMFGPELGTRLFAFEEGRRERRVEMSMPVIRSVVMGPLALNAKRSSDRALLADVFAMDLQERTCRVLDDIRGEGLMASFTSHETIVSLDDKGDVEQLLTGALALPQNVQLTHLRSFEEFETKIGAPAPVRFVFLDVDLGPGREAQGFDAFDRVCLRNDNADGPSHRVERVVFLTVGSKGLVAKCRAIAGKYRNPPLWGWLRKPVRGDDMQKFSQRIRGVLTETPNAGRIGEQP